MSFTRNNIFYQSLPINSTSASSSSSSTSKYNQPSAASAQQQKTVNFSMQSTPAGTTSSAAAQTSSINTEEFAKLDALLEDLLAEVDQPLLLNKEIKFRETTSSNSWNANANNGRNMSSTNGQQQQQQQHIDDIEKSVDWLNEQKEILKSRREQATAATANKYNSLRGGMASDNDENVLFTNKNNASNGQAPSYRKIKSKLDYYITNSNESNGSATNGGRNGGCGGGGGGSYSYSSNVDNLKSGGFANQNEHHHQDSALNGEMSGDDLVGMRQVPIVNNKPPVSPNTRNVYSPTNQQQPQQQTLISSSFRSLSNNPALLVSILAASLILGCKKIQN
jgi:hypothetical protein